MAEYQVSVVITALNEERNVLAAIDSAFKAFKDYGINGEVVFINDGSTDSTGRVVAQKYGADPRLQSITHEAPHGVGGSFWEGVDIARGEAVCWLPGDNESDPWEIMRYYPLLEHVDMVIPFIFNTAVRPASRRFISQLYVQIINHTFGTSFNYTNATILYRKSIFRMLPSRVSSFFFQTDALVRLVKAGCLYAEVPARLGVRDAGESKALSLKSFRKVAGAYLRLVWDYYMKGGGAVAREFPKDTQTYKRRKA
jgi:glycosyltransferase involved in cell wall biosynthesis